MFDVDEYVESLVEMLTQDTDEAYVYVISAIDEDDCTFIGLVSPAYTNFEAAQKHASLLEAENTNVQYCIEILPLKSFFRVN